MDACIYDGCIGGQLTNAGEAVDDVKTVEDCHNACQNKVGCQWFKFSYGNSLYSGKPICSIVSDIAWAGSETQGTGIYDFDTTYTHFLSCPMASFVASSTTTTTTSSTTSACPGYCPDGKAMNGKNCKDYHMDACIYDGCIGGQLTNAGEAVDDVKTVEDCHNACQNKVGCQWFKFSYGNSLYSGKPICSIVSDIAWAGSETQGTGIYDFDTTYTHFLSCPVLAADTTTVPPTTTGIFSGPKCKKWCSTSSELWSAKCTWKKCRQCPQCGAIQKPKRCKRWCSRNSDDWSTKCTWKKCRGCSECTEDRRLQSSAATFASGRAEDLSIGMVLV